MADIIGRKPIYLVCLVLYICVVIGTLFCKNLWLCISLMFFGGVAETGRYYVAYVYIIEFMPLKHQDAAGLYLFLIFSLVMAFISLQFWFVVRYWQVNAA